MSRPSEVVATVQSRNASWFPRYRPAHEVYREQAGGLVSANGAILHLGAGRDSLGVREGLSGFRGRFVSLDVDEDGLRNNANEHRVVATASHLPFQSGSFDLVMADNVFEHLERPEAVLRECHRCLKSNGALVFLCPNQFSYIAILSRLSPHWVHAKFKQHTMGVPESDTFPTFYRLNSMGRIGKLASGTGFHLESIQSYVGWPTYWEFSDYVHRVFTLVHRGIEMLPAWTHITLVGVLRRVDGRTEK